MGIVCHSGRHYYPNPANENRNCCSHLQLGDQGRLGEDKKRLEGQLKRENEKAADAHRELDSAQGILKRLQAELAEVQAKRHESLSKGNVPGADASLGSLASDIEVSQKIIVEKSSALRRAHNTCSAIQLQLNTVNGELARFELYARRDVVHEKMRKVLLEWNKLVTEMLAIRREARKEHSVLDQSCLNWGEYPIFPIGVKNPNWFENPELEIEILALKPSLNFNADGKRMPFSYD